MYKYEFISIFILYIGEYYFSCWNMKKIMPLSIYWTKEGIDALKRKRETYERILKNKHLFSDKERHSYCRIPLCKLYWG